MSQVPKTPAAGAGAAHVDRPAPARRPALSLTYDVAERVTRLFVEKYLSGLLDNELPQLDAKRDGQVITPWRPGETKVLRNQYILGMFTAFDIDGRYGPQCRLHVRIGSDGLSGGMKKPSLKAMTHWLGTLFADMARSVDDLHRVFAARGLEGPGSLTAGDFSHWFTVFAGPVPRLTKGGKGKGKVLTIGDTISNPSGRTPASGRVTAFVHEHGGDPKQSPRLALSAGHVVTCFGAAPHGTTVQVVRNADGTNVGNYGAPHPFPFVAGERVTCDAALVALDKQWRASNRIRYQGRNHRITGAIVEATESIAMRNSVELGVVREGTKVSPAVLRGANLAQGFLDDEDNIHHYEGLFAMTVWQRTGSGTTPQPVRPGDSGALVVRKSDFENDRAVKNPWLHGLGLVIGGQAGKGGNALAYFMRLDHALQTLNVEVAK